MSLDGLAFALCVLSFCCVVNYQSVSKLKSRVEELESIIEDLD